MDYDPKDKNIITIINHEVTAISQLDHPKIVKIYSVFKGEDTFRILYEWIEGKQLKRIITDDNSHNKVDGKLDEGIIACILRQIFLALIYMHETNDVFHLDLSLDNIMYF